jgi:hypothetical protein
MIAGNDNDAELIEDTLLVLAEIMELAQKREQAIRVDVFHTLLRQAALEIKRLRNALLEAETTIATQQASMRY